MTAMPARSLPYPLGVSVRGGGVNVAVYSSSAERIEFCVFDEGGGEQRTVLSQRTGHVFHDLIADVGLGAKYALRVHGAWDPKSGLRHNPHKLLLDPHATAISGDYRWGQAVFAQNMNDPEAMDETDGAGSTPLCVVTDPSFDWGEDTHPLVPLADSVIYETHVKGFTQLHPDVPEEIRGTYAGLGHPAAVKHLVDLGVTAVELLPVHQFVHDSHLLERGSATTGVTTRSHSWPRTVITAPAAMTVDRWTSSRRW